MIGQKLEESDDTVSGVVAISVHEPLAAFTIAVKGFETVYLPTANVYGVQENFKFTAIMSHSILSHT